MTVHRPVPNLGVATGDGEAAQVAASIPCIVYECSSDLVVTAASPNTFELIGIRPENILGKRALWEDRLHAADCRRLVARLNQLGGTEVAFESHKIKNDRGLPIWVAHSFTKRKTSQGETIHGCMLPLPKELRATSLDHSIISQFVHKIGNHFQLINLLIGSLKRSGTKIDAEIDSLQQTIDKAVEFTRSFSHFSQSVASPSIVDLGETLRSVIKSMSPSFFEKTIGVKDDLEQSLDGATVYGDPFLLEFAFGSLFNNALDAMRSGDRLVIKGSSETGVDEGSIARITIADTGCGIESTALAKVAEPFFTLRRDRDGLGLSSAIRIFEMHGGAVNISSTLGQGTEVQILLPIDRRSNQVRNSLIGERK